MHRCYKMKLRSLLTEGTWKKTEAKGVYKNLDDLLSKVENETLEARIAGLKRVLSGIEKILTIAYHGKLSDEQRQSLINSFGKIKKLKVKTIPLEQESFAKELEYITKLDTQYQSLYKATETIMKMGEELFKKTGS